MKLNDYFKQINFNLKIYLNNIIKNNSYLFSSMLLKSITLEKNKW